ncbi:MAG TPA: tetratricopeptide repeat protein, partial [bacterium]|nr:tetratricopeptide repeat protein [bacterium]
ALEKAVTEAQVTNVMAEIALAFIDYQEKAFAKAAATADGLLAKYPNNIILRTLKGDCLIQQKKFPEAVAEFEKILSIEPDVTKAYLYMGMAYAREGKDKARAKEFLQKYLSLDTKASDEWRDPASNALKALEKPEGAAGEQKLPESFGSIIR